MQIINKIPVVRSLYRSWCFSRFQKAWRRQNRHNQTVACNAFPPAVVTVGQGTYGELHVMSYYPAKERLAIGNYVSLAPGVRFILGGNHQVHTLFPFPIRSRIIGGHCEEDAATRGPIVVEDEAWIGYGATVLSGVTIGKGAIVGAQAVVREVEAARAGDRPGGRNLTERHSPQPLGRIGRGVLYPHRRTDRHRQTVEQDYTIWKYEIRRK